jgi:hypothetical protein
VTHAIASSFTTAAVFDLCALIVIAFAIRLRMGGPDGGETADARVPVSAQEPDAAGVG